LKKIKDTEALKNRTARLTNDLRLIIEGMDEKRGKIFLEWMQNQNKYLLWEKTFDPLKLKKYKRGEVVFAHFGFNVGAEYGGLHYAVIVKKDKKSNPILNVVPLSSLKDGQTETSLHFDEVFLGCIEGLNEKEAFAIPNQMRPVSKLRVYRPRFANESLVTLTDEQLDSIDAKVADMYTKN